MLAKKTAPFGITNITKQELYPIFSLLETNHRSLEYSCALACPAGGASGRAWLFWYFLCQDKKYRRSVQLKESTNKLHLRRSPLDKEKN